MAIWICGAFFLASLAATRLLCNGMPFNPLSAFFGVWLFGLGLYELDRVFEIFYVRLSEDANSLLILSFAWFFIAAILGMIIAIRVVRARALSIDDKQLNVIYKVTLLLFAVFLTGVMWKYSIVISKYGALFENLPDIRQEAFTGELTFPFISRLMTVLGYMVVLNLSILAVFRRKAKFISLLVVAILLNFLNDSTTGMRGSTVNSVLFLVSAVLLSGTVLMKRIGIKHLLMGTCILLGGVLLVTGILYLRDGGARSFLERLTRDNYVYTVGTIPSLSVFIDNPWPASVPGQWTFAGLYQLLDIVLANLIGVTLLSAETFDTFYAPITRLGPFNSSGYLLYFYSDLREPGVVVFSALMGFASAYLFMKAVLQKQIVDIQLAALLMSLVIFSIRGIYTNGMSFWVTLTLVIIQHQMLLGWRKGGKASAGLSKAKQWARDGV